MLRGMSFSRYIYFLSLFSWVWIKNHFPFFGPFVNFSQDTVLYICNLKLKRYHQQTYIAVYIICLAINIFKEK